MSVSGPYDSLVFKLSLLVLKHCPIHRLCIILSYLVKIPRLVVMRVDGGGGGGGGGGGAWVPNKNVASH